MIAAPELALRHIDDLIAYARNSRTHSPEQVTQLASAMVEFGFTNAVLADDKGIVAGHGRVMALRELYAQGVDVKYPNGALIPLGMVPVVDCSGWSESQRRAYVIWDNKSALLSGWDEDVLKLEFADLESDGYDLGFTGFGGDDLSDILGRPDPAPDADPDVVPPVPDAPQSVMGDVWVCGAHRISCNDSTDLAAWDVLMRGELADLCITDPPYNVDIGAKNEMLDRADGGNRSKNGAIKNDKMGDAAFRTFLDAAHEAVFENMKPGASIYVAHADLEGINFRSAFKDAGFKLSSCLIWRKNMIVLGRSPYQWIHEPILFGFKPGSKHKWFGGRKLKTVMDHGEGGPITRLEDGRWAIKSGDATLIVAGDATMEEIPGSVIFNAKPSKSGLHPTTKPIELWEKLMAASSRAGDLVIDGFSGSGTTLIAADRLGMVARVMELDPKYVDVAVIRWQDLTGRRAVHAVTGEEFPADGERRELVAPVVDDGVVF